MGCYENTWVRYLIFSTVVREGVMLAGMSEMKSEGWVELKQVKRVPQIGNSVCKGLQVGGLMEREDVTTVQYGRYMEWEVRTGQR